MHSAVLQGKKYIKFADESTVEVICMNGVDQGVKKGHRNALTYKKEVDGEEVELMVAFPNLTFDEMMALLRSKANQYKDADVSPYTSLVNPHTQEEMAKIIGAFSDSKMMEKVREATKSLREEYGRGISRQEIRDLEDAEVAARAEAAKGNYGKAIAALGKASKSVADWPQQMQDRVNQARREITDAAELALDAIKETSHEDPEGALKSLSRLKQKLRGTGLEQRAKELMTELKSL